MVVFCPGCGSRISVQPEAPGGAVQCPRCQSTFSTAGLKSADDLPQPKRFRPKTAGRGKLGGVLITLAVLFVLGGGTAAALYFTGVIGSRAATSGSAFQTHWQTYANPEGLFRVQFPGTPTRDTVPPPSKLKPGAKPRVVSFSVELPAANYSVAYEDFEGKETPEQFIDKWRSSLGGGTKLVSEKDVPARSREGVTIDKGTGKDFVIAVDGRTAHVRFYTFGRRLYKLMVVGTGKPPDPHDAALFMDSFRIQTMI
jgi:hypothetical protein